MDLPADLVRSRPGRLLAMAVALVVLAGACLYARAGDESSLAVGDDVRLSATALTVAGTDPPGTGPPATEPPPGTEPPPPPRPATSTTASPAPAPIVAIGPPPQLAPLTCLGRQPSSAADYTGVFARRDVWSGGDIAATVDLGDERVLWLFGDTFVDGLGPEGRPGAMVRNSLVVQRGGCFWLATYGPRGARREALPAAQAGEWLWPMGAVVDPAGLIHVTALRMAATAGAPGWDWRVTGTDIVTLRWVDLALVATRHAPVRQGEDVRWAGGTFRFGDHVYVYGWRKDHQVVARAPLTGFARDRWELLSGNAWTTDVDRATPVRIERAPASQFWVIPHAGGFLASAKSVEMNSDDVSTWWSSSPTGPFRAVGRAAHTEGEGSPWITYAGRVTPLPGAGLVAVWSRNYRAHDPNMDVRRYGPLFAAPLPGSIP